MENPKVTTVYAESTPNPATRWKLAFREQIFIGQESVEYSAKESMAVNCPLTASNLRYDFLAFCRSFANFTLSGITLTKNSDVDWRRPWVYWGVYQIATWRMVNRFFTGPTGTRSLTAEIEKRKPLQPLKLKSLKETLEEYGRTGCCWTRWRTIHFKIFDSGIVTLVP